MLVILFAQPPDSYFNLLAYTDIRETARLTRSIKYTAGCETQFRDQPSITAQQGYVLKSIKINFVSIKYKCTKLPFSPKN